MTLKQSNGIFCAVGKVKKILSKVVIFVVYIPPTTKTAEFKKTISDALVHKIAGIRTSIKDPIIFLGGDFNHGDMGLELELAGDLRRVQNGPTRGNNMLDIIYANNYKAITELKVLAPLDSPTGGVSDHKYVYLETKFGKGRKYKWIVRRRRTRGRRPLLRTLRGGTGSPF